MAQTLTSMIRSLLVVATLSLALAPHAHAQDGAAPETPAATAAAAPATAEKAVAAPAAAAEKPLSDAEKKALLEAAESVTAFDASKVIGAPTPWQLYYQPASSGPFAELQKLHDGVLIVITLITLFVMALMAYIMLRFSKRRNPKPATFTHNKLVEVIWTVVPILILVGIAIPSIRVHYKSYNNETIIQNPDVTIKVTGHQWYWEYEYPESGIKFDSNMTKDADLPAGAPRLLEVDNAVVVPVNKVVRVQLTSADVIHAWAMPAFGLKKAAVPGRLNETWFKAEQEGIYYGQCSVLCGKLHGYMPIKIVVVSDADYARWVKGAQLKFAADTARFEFAGL